ncbi:Dyp-type peroxidase [Podospora aff. communis PSN243]|uniref:Dyp-type peroxidase n=1 Tax=Podospora aff. communis PSN243 TaxID=3040156 RepID=A0AAV9GWM8_9PEZI|nr:Dyp-type peroxidase [Podospora aff. communis PSN243]
MASDSKDEKLQDVLQGDIWSKGFPKYHETYYLFQIDPNRAKEFARSLRTLVHPQSSLISSLAKVKRDWDRIQVEKTRSEAAKEPKPKELDMANALIAFTFKGLDVINHGLSSTDDILELGVVESTDPAFSRGMKEDGTSLHDSTIVDAPFDSPNLVIHGLLKVAGNSPQMVNDLLEKIKKALNHDKKVIMDLPGGDKVPSRIDGATREDRGKEHFGFEDGISQPLMAGIDTIPPAAKADDFTMVTDQSILIVTDETHTSIMPQRRPKWMHRGSFLVFRKLEQNVDAFHDLCEQNYKKFHLENAAHLAAKLMGRWPSGAPIAVNTYATADAPHKDLETVKRMNHFSYEPVHPPAPRLCPLSAHIRKTNPRVSPGTNDGDRGFRFSRIIRGGIPYGKEWKKGDGLKRGLLFSCYQGYIEDGFRHMQVGWCNDADFPNIRREKVGIDPIVGQHKDPNTMESLIIEARPGVEEKGQSLPITPQLVTFRGGEYFFAPSIKALREELSNV